MQVLNIGQRIRKIRLEKNLKLKDIAGADISITKLSFIENSKIIPSTKELSDIASALGVKVSELNIPIKTQLESNYKRIAREAGSLSEFKELIDVSDKHGENELSFDFLVDYTYLMVLNSSQEEIIELLPYMFKNVLNSYSNEKMSEYIFVVANYLTNCNENISSVIFLKHIFQLIKEKEDILRNLPIFYNCYLRAYLSSFKIKEASKMVDHIYKNIDKIEMNVVRAESIFLIKAFTMLSQEEIKYSINKDDATEGLSNYPYRLSENYILLSDIAFEKNNKKEAIKYLKNAESSASKNEELKYMSLLDSIIKRFIAKGCFEEAEEYIDIYINKSNSQGILKHIEKSYWYKSIYSYKMNKIDEAKIFLSLSIDALKKHGNEKALSERFNDLATLYFNIGEYNMSIESLRYADDAFSLS